MDEDTPPSRGDKRACPQCSTPYGGAYRDSSNRYCFQSIAAVGLGIRASGRLDTLPCLALQSVRANRNWDTEQVFCSAHMTLTHYRRK